MNALEGRYDGPIPLAERGDGQIQRTLIACHAALTSEAGALRQAHADLGCSLAAIERTLDVLWRAAVAGEGD
ncbi:MAG: hypothetical protein EXQ94_03110 [Alphaproteobacteria bacterium]|nr:hypothetical protein [Alphaproteobacteria bacterium]